MSVPQPQGQVLNASSPIQLEGQRSGMVAEASSKMERNKKIIRGLGIAEVVIGSICLAVGAIVTAYSVQARITSYSVLSNNGYNNNSYYSYFRDINIGQAMWCGIWVFIAGCLGVGVGGKKASRCLINTHMGFAIVGAVASGLLFIFNMIRVFVISGYGNTFRLGLVIPTVIGSFVALIILTISASYSCCITCGICCADCCGNDHSETSIATNNDNAPVDSALFPTDKYGYVVVDGLYKQSNNKQTSNITNEANARDGSAILPTGGFAEDKDGYLAFTGPNAQFSNITNDENAQSGSAFLPTVGVAEDKHGYLVANGPISPVQTSIATNNDNAPVHSALFPTDKYGYVDLYKQSNNKQTNMATLTSTSKATTNKNTTKKQICTSLHSLTNMRKC